jgi:hypothetical protein
MDGSFMPAKGLESMLDELAGLDLRALRAARAGHRQDLCDASEKLLALHARFATLYRGMLAAQLPPVARGRRDNQGRPPKTHDTSLRSAGS